MKKLFAISILLLGACGLRAQQNAAYSMYMFNSQFINPAYAGSKDQLSLSANYRHQWAGMQGAPRTFGFGAHSPLKKMQYGMGLMLVHDRIGVSTFSSLYTQYAYRLRLGNDMKLAFGLQAGFTHYSPRYDELVLADAGNGTDQAFANSQSLFLPNFGFGAYFSGKQFYVGLSVPHILTLSLSDKLEMVSGNSDLSRQFRHYLLHAGYVFGEAHAKIKVKPSVLLKYVPGTPFDADLSCSVLFVDRYWIGASYRMGGNRGANNAIGLGEALIGMFEMKVTQQLAIGYSYDHSLSQLNQVSSGSHEIFVGYQFSFIKNSFVDPRYIKHF